MAPQGCFAVIGPIPEKIIAALVSFALLFTEPVRDYAQVLLVGAVLEG